jgi:hypothetical protein
MSFACCAFIDLLSGHLRDTRDADSALRFAVRACPRAL